MLSAIYENSLEYQTACPSVTESRFFRVSILYFTQIEIYQAEVFTEYITLSPLGLGGVSLALFFLFWVLYQKYMP